MPRQSIADVLAATLASADVERIWSVTGDSLNALNIVKSAAGWSSVIS